MYAIVFKDTADRQVKMELVAGESKSQALENFNSWDCNKRYPPKVYSITEIN